MQETEDRERQLRILCEAHQYLRGAHALFATSATGRRVENARDFSMDGLRGLLNAMFDSVSEELDEREEQLLLEPVAISSPPAT